MNLLDPQRVLTLVGHLHYKSTEITEEASLALCLKRRAVECCRLNLCKALHVLSLTLQGGDGTTDHFIFTPGEHSPDNMNQSRVTLAFQESSPCCPAHSHNRFTQYARLPHLVALK